MIRGITLKNFKRFRECPLPLRRMSVLTGLNGAGKTSVIHALLLLRQASARHPSPEFVSLNGPFGLALGEALDVLHGTAEPEEGITIEVDTEELNQNSWMFSVEEQGRSLNLQIMQRPERAPAVLSGKGRLFNYLCAERLGPRDVLGADSVALSELGVGHQGEFTAQVLSVLEREVIRAGRLHPQTEERGGVTTLRKQAEWWISSTVRPVEIDAQWFTTSNVTAIRYKTPGVRSEWTRPTNMGFGVSYALPVVVAGLLAPPGGIFIVENPEAHLHPAGQSAMGDFLVRIAADGVQVIVETHSDHVLNGIRRAIGERGLLAADEAIIHFFEGTAEAQPVVSRIDVRSTGDLSAWPAGFFDQMDTDLAALARARRLRR
ncbi:DUF3696 domain-containing protein [Corallococcus exercitus]|uniref:AAA family ATPase n=1 Tax=Corallococcus exercitus TaxID=2316736 RepID=UPI000EA38F33|nr:DUF3696 domain-containing protein [Corallococcus exercitus]RKG70223.1 DUF3696 domain-containing protein [Corallococcus exercitus]